jgi:hypothetical protein
MHRHRWRVTARRYTPPTNREINGPASHAFIDVAMRLATGFTTIEQTCAVCGKTRFDDVLGDQRGEE